MVDENLRLSGMARIDVVRILRRGEGKSDSHRHITTSWNQNIQR